MRSYLVTIKVADSRKKINDRLAAAFGTSTAQKAHIIEADEIVADEFCRINKHFGCVHWTDEDLHAKLKELEVPITPELMSILKTGYSLRHINERMIETGWDVIEESILDVRTP
jgi:hypothetical protein